MPGVEGKGIQQVHGSDMTADDKEVELDRAIRLTASDPVRAASALFALRARALAEDAPRCAAACLRALAMAMPPQEWLTECAGALLREDPRGHTYWSVAALQERAGRLEEALANYERAVEMERNSPRDPEILELALDGIKRLRGK